ncbi:MAG: hypothetical protein AAGF23_14565 [Acidobacteriota bacterium]
MKKLVLPLLAATLVLVSALFVLAPAQTAEARAPQPHELDPDVPGVTCWDAHLSVDSNNDHVFDLGWNVASGPDYNFCLDVLTDMIQHAKNMGWTYENAHCYSYTASPACRIESIL